MLIPPVIGVPAHVLAQSFVEIQASGQFAEGSFTRRFEELIEGWCAQPTVAMNSGGSALLAALTYFRHEQSKHRWAVQNNTFYATGASVLAAGCEIRLIDCDVSSFCMDYQKLKKLSPRELDGVLLTHVGGSLCRDYELIAALCRARGWRLLEDAAHAVGVRDEQGRTAGALGDAACFSFYPTKAVPVGDAGALSSRNAELILYARRLRNYSKYQAAGGIRYDRRMVGFNWRMSEWAAAVGCHQMNRLTEILEKRSADAEQLKRVCLPQIGIAGHTNWYKYIVPSAFAATQNTGQVYCRADQLDQSLVRTTELFPDSEHLAVSHRCLPVGEGFYAGMSPGQIEQALFS